MNEELANKIADIIEFQPEKYNQETYMSECGTTACVAGHALLLTGWEWGSWFEAPEKDGVAKNPHNAAQIELGITEDEAHYLFAAETDRDEILHFLRKGKFPDESLFNQLMNSQIVDVEDTIMTNPENYREEGFLFKGEIGTEEWTEEEGWISLPATDEGLIWTQEMEKPMSYKEYKDNNDDI